MENKGRISEIFEEYPKVEVIEILDYDDGGPCGLSEDGRTYRVFSRDYAAQGLSGQTTVEGFPVKADYVTHYDRCKAVVSRDKNKE